MRCIQVFRSWKPRQASIRTVAARWARGPGTAGKEPCGGKKPTRSVKRGAVAGAQIQRRFCAGSVNELGERARALGQEGLGGRCPRRSMSLPASARGRVLTLGSGFGRAANRAARFRRARAGNPGPRNCARCSKLGRARALFVGFLLVHLLLSSLAVSALAQGLDTLAPVQKNRVCRYCFG